MPIQRHNPERDNLLTPDRQAYEHYHEPLGDLGAFNGQFDTGPDGRYPAIEGWELDPDSGGTIDRVTGGLAGNYRARGGRAGLGTGGRLISSKYFAVDEDRDYYLSGAFITNNAAATISFGLRCYTAAKAFISTQLVVSGVAVGTSWIRYQRNIGPNGDVAWAANTRYARIFILLQNNAALTGAYAYADDIQFQQLKKTYSPLIQLVNGVASDALQDFTAQAFTLWANSAITLTLEEPGYLWWGYQFFTKNQTNIRTTSCEMQVFIDGVGQGLALQQGHVATTSTEPAALVGRSDAILAVGARTVDVRINVTFAGDTVRGNNITGYAYYTRAY